MPCGKQKICATCQNLKPSLTIIMGNVFDIYQYFKNNKFMSKNLHNATCQILVYG